MKKKLGKGKPITELVKGSIEYTMSEINNAFRAQFPSSDMGPYFYIADTFADYLVVSAYMSSANPLKSDEYYKVTYSKSGDSYTFAPRDQWEVVELTYQPQIVISESMKKNGKRFEEKIEPSQVQLLESKDEAKKTHRIRINDLVVADEVNGNNRLYSQNVIEAMVKDWQPYLRESRGQGRLMILTGEVEHPSDKGKKRPEFLETVVRWDTLDWDGKKVDIEGNLILTNKGRDVEILMEAGVLPGGSIRGIGESKIKKVDGKKVEVMEWISLNAADLVGDPSFKNAAALQESINSSEDEMNELLEQLKALLAEHPELFGKGMNEAQLEALNEKQLKKLDESLRSALGIDPNANIVETVKTNAEKARKFDASEAKQAVDAAIVEATKDLPFGKNLNEMFVEALKESNPATPEAVKQFAESKRKEYGKLAASGALKGMGFKEGKITSIAPVLERETGTPEFARTSFELCESIRKHEGRSKSAIIERAESPAAVFTALLLERFDKLHQRELMQEAQLFTEQELTTDLNLPYSVSRAIIEEAFPNLVAANIFDVGTMDTSPTRLYFEATTGETGYTVAITDEVETGGAEGTWYALSHGRITPASVTVTSNPAGTTYVEGIDYVINYADGKIKFLTPGSIGANDVLVNYTYSAIRNGEMAVIERVKTSLSYKTIEAAADRLADQISREAIVFSRSQLGWDAVARTMANLVKQMRRKIDQGLLYMAFSAVKSVASNSTTAWTISSADADLQTLYTLLGNAAVIVAKRFYEPTFYLASITNTDRLSNWSGFKRDGFPQALLNAAGFAGMVKNRPIFSSTEFSDALWICGNRELVQHRVFLPLSIKGPFPTYDVSGGTSKLVAADQYYAEEFNATESTVPEKGAFVPVEAAAS
jgi:hypothetical protein